MKSGFLIAILTIVAHQTSAWIYPEHRYIAILAIEKLNPDQRAAFQRLWLEARMGYSERLTESAIEPGQGVEPNQLDYASWTAIAGDHSCSPQDMLNNILRTKWILQVADIAARLKLDIEKSRNRSQHINVLRNSDIRLQRVDPSYATRAGSNNVHFLLARPQPETNAKEYFAACTKEGVELNALGTYSWFHTAALHKAARYADEQLTPEQKSALILAALADEAFALHFLEDVYASGHTAGTWGVSSLRKGTHDYYNEEGLEIVTWNGIRTISLGDAFMRDADAEMAASSVKLSLGQLIKVATGDWKFNEGKPAKTFISSLPDTFNVCRNTIQPLHNNMGSGSGQMIDETTYLNEILVGTPVPGLADGLGEIPRFRSEVGMFVGTSFSVNGSSINGGFAYNQNQSGFVGGMEGNVRFGFGLDGVLNQSGDGLVFLQAGYRLDGSSTNKFTDDVPGSTPGGYILSAIPGRSAFNVRLRLPFWLIPGDLLIAGPILMLVSPKTLSKMAVTAGNGGLVPWQSGFATPAGHFQFVLGREIGISYYGIKENGILVTAPTATLSTAVFLISYGSTKFEFPILEYRPFRTFSMDQSTGVIVQLTTGVDVPFGATVITPVGEPVPSLKPVWNLGVRIMFNWRHYF